MLVDFFVATYCNSTIVIAYNGLRLCLNADCVSSTPVLCKDLANITSGRRSLVCLNMIIFLLI